MKREPEPGEAPKPRLERQRFARQLRSLNKLAQKNSTAAQARYKLDHDSRIRPLLPDKLGDSVFLEHQGNLEESSDGERQNRKPIPRAYGP